MKTILRISLIILISSVIGFAVNAFSPKGIAIVGQWDKSSGVVTAGTKGEAIPHDVEIQTTSLAYDIYKAKTSLFVDARDADIFVQGHIAGAISVPVNDYGKIFHEFIKKHPLNQDIVVYCSGRECDDSHKLARYLKEDGYTNIRVFIDGYSVWEKEGLPIEKGN